MINILNGKILSLTNFKYIKQDMQKHNVTFLGVLIMDLNIKVNEKNHLDIGGADAIDIAEEFGIPTLLS